MQVALANDGRKVEINYLPMRNKNQFLLDRPIPTGLCEKDSQAQTLGYGHENGMPVPKSAFLNPSGLLGREVLTGLQEVRDLLDWYQAARCLCVTKAQDLSVRSWSGPNRRVKKTL